MSKARREERKKMLKDTLNAIPKRNHELRALLRDGRFAEAQAVLARSGRDLDRDPRAKAAPQARAHGFERVVFICGLHRSGTTLLHDHLASLYAVSFIRDAKVPENEGQFVQDVFPLERSYGGPGTFAFFRQMQFPPVADPDRARADAARLLGQWAAHTVPPDQRVLLEKSPPNLVRIPYLRSLFPGARFVIWTRDPRAVSLATKKWKDVPIHSLMMHWNSAYMAAFADLGEDCIVASYEAFCRDPQGETRRVAEFCALEERAEPLDLHGRFREVRDANGKYLDAFPEVFLPRIPIRAWEIFGYDLKRAGTPKG